MSWRPVSCTGMIHHSYVDYLYKLQGLFAILHLFLTTWILKEVAIMLVAFQTLYFDDVIQHFCSDIYQLWWIWYNLWPNAASYFRWDTRHRLIEVGVWAKNCYKTNKFCDIFLAMWMVSSGVRITNDFWPAIQIKWKICLAIIPLPAIRS